MQESSTFVGHSNCERCGSSDALALYDDGHTYCFSCSAHSGGDGGESKQTKLPKDLIGDLMFRAIPSRKLTEETCTYWRYGFGKHKGEDCQVAQYWREGQVVAQKLRFANKNFSIVGDGKKMPLFGQHLWHGARMITVTEGELDALSVSQAQGNKWPVVSVPNGAQGAARSFRDNLTYLESFETVVIMFDMDEPGQKAAAECARLLSPGKAKIASLPHKDANEMLKEGKEAELIRAIWNAKPYRPDGIVAAEDLWDQVIKPVERGISYPWPTLTDLTYGIRTKELVVFGAGTGMGKSLFLKSIATHLVLTHQTTVGMLLLEESNRDTITSMMGQASGKLFHIPGHEYTVEEKREAFDSLFRSEHVRLYDSFGQTDWDVVSERIRYMVVANGCKAIFLDHLTMLTDGADAEENLNQKVKAMVNELASMTRELDFTCFAVSHLRKSQGKPHEEGGRVHLDDLYGSSAIKQYASFAYGLERNQQDADEDKRHTTTLRILKDRYTGRGLGKTVDVRYEREAGRLIEEGYGEDF